MTDFNSRAVSSAVTSVDSTTESATILAADNNRRGAVIVNTDANALYLLLSAGTASATNYTAALAEDEEYQVPFGYCGIITGVWAVDGSGAAIVTAFS